MSDSAWGDDGDISAPPKRYQRIGSDKNVQKGDSEGRRGLCCGAPRAACCGEEKGTFCCGKLRKKGCVIMSAVFFLTFGIFLVLSYFVFGPMFAQHTLNNAEITFTEMVIGEVDANGTSFQSTVKAVLSNAGSIDATVDSMSMDMYYEEIIVGTVQMPVVNIVGGKDSIIESTSTFEIANQTNFVRFSADMIRKDALELRLKGVCDLTAKVGVNIKFGELIFDKSVYLIGLGGLKEIKILTFDPTVSDKTNVKMAITALLKNPSIVEMTEVGDLNFEIFYKGQHLGHMVAPEAKVVHGDNYLNMTGFIKPDNTSAPDVIEGVSLLLSGKPVALEAVGADKNASTVPLFAPAFKGLVIQTQVINPFKALITKVDMKHVKMILSADKPDDLVMSFTTSVTIESPLGPVCPINVKTVQLDTTIWTLEKDAKVTIATDGTITPIKNAKNFGSSSTPVAVIADGSKPTFDFSLSTNVKMTDEDAFSDFAYGFISNAKTYMAMQGKSKVSMQTPAGLLTAHDLPYQNVVAMAGLDKLKDVKLEMLNLYLLGGSKEDGLEAAGQLKMNNPTKVGLDLGPNSDMILDIYYKDTKIGFSNISQFILNEGDNVNLYPMRMNLVPGTKLVQRMLSDYLNGFDSPVVVKARQSKLPYLAKMLQQMILPTVVRGSKINLMPGAQMHVALGLYIPTNLIMENPFNTTMSIIAWDIKVYMDDKQIGYSKNTHSSQADAKPIVLPALQRTTSERVNIYPSAKWQTLKAVLKALRKSDITLTMDGRLTVQVGTFEAEVFYKATNIKTSLKIIGKEKNSD